MATLRRSEAYWIEARKRWQINVQREGRRKTFTSSTPGKRGKHEAEAKADHWAATFLTQQKLTAAWEAFAEDHKKKVQKGTWDMYEGKWRNHVAPCFTPGKMLHQISPYEWQNVINKMAENGASAGSCKGVRTLIMMVIDYAISRNWEVKEMREGAIEIPKEAKAAKAKHALPHDELMRLINATKEDNWYTYAFQFLVYTGLRRGEMLALEWADVDIKEKRITVNKSLNPLGETTHGKTANAARTVPLQAAAVDVLEKQRAMLSGMGLLTKHVFTDVTGGQTRVRLIDCNFRKFCKELDVKCAMHELRHTFISICKKDMPLALLKQAVGHGSNMDTYAVYGHEIESDVIAASKIIDDAFKGQKDKN